MDRNHYRTLIWHTLRGLSIVGAKHHAKVCQALIMTIPWNCWPKISKSDEMLQDAVRAIAGNTAKACHVFNERYNSIYSDVQTDNLPTLQYYVAGWAAREVLEKYLVN